MKYIGSMFEETDQRPSPELLMAVFKMFCEEFSLLYQDNKLPDQEMFECFLKTCENTKNDEFLTFMTEFTEKPGILEYIGKHI